MSHVLRWGLLGTGHMATAFASDLAGAPGAKLAAVGSRHAASAKAFAASHSGIRSHGSYQALADNPDIDAVYIATPHNLHFENALMCLEAGKAVLCEKSFTLNRNQAAAVMAKAKARNLFLMEAMWTRFLPAMVKLRQLIRDGRIGNITFIQAGGGFMPAYDAKHYLFDIQRGGGVLLDAGVYLVHLAEMLMGQPSEIRALGHLGPYGVDDQFGLLLGYEGGGQADLHVSLRHQERPEATVFGELGRIHVHAPVFAPSALTYAPYEGDAETFTFDNSGGYGFQALEVARCMARGLTESPLMPWSETLNVMAVMDEARRQIGLRYPQEFRY